VRALPFPDATFDVCRAAQLLEHLPDAGRALSEMIRVTRRGGRVVVFDFDWNTLTIDHPDKETTEPLSCRIPTRYETAGSGASG
jgi:ubiquinone/menaquinone biosynthesis C-methylase UbiE